MLHANMLHRSVALWHGNRSPAHVKFKLLVQKCQIWKFADKCYQIFSIYVPLQGACMFLICLCLWWTYNQLISIYHDWYRLTNLRWLIAAKLPIVSEKFGDAKVERTSCIPRQMWWGSHVACQLCRKSDVFVCHIFGDLSL